MRDVEHDGRLPPGERHPAWRPHERRERARDMEEREIPRERERDRDRYQQQDYWYPDRVPYPRRDSGQEYDRSARLRDPRGDHRADYRGDYRSDYRADHRGEQRGEYRGASRGEYRGDPREDARGDASWNTPRPPRSHSPHSSRRSSPTTSRHQSPPRSRRPSPPAERREEIPTRASLRASEGEQQSYPPPPREGSIPTGPRGAPTGPSRMNVPPPSGPRFHRPPPGPGYTGWAGEPPIGTGGSRPPAPPDDPPRQLSRRVDERGVPLSAQIVPDGGRPSSSMDDSPVWSEGERARKESVSVVPAIPTEQRNAEPDRLQVLPPNEAKIVETGPPPSTPASVSAAQGGKRGPLTEADMPGSAFAQMEAEVRVWVAVPYTSSNPLKGFFSWQVHNMRTARIASANKFHASAPLVGLRLALRGLADSEVELAGARVKTSVTEAALDKAREEAEMWSLESGRIEINERNSGVQGWLASS